MNKFACSPCKGPKTGAISIKERDSGSQFSDALTMSTFTHQLSVGRA